MDFTIDPDFSQLCPPLTAEEKMTLEDSLMRQGCRDPLIIWGEKNILVDGHNRYEICTKLRIPFHTKTLSFIDRRGARDWIIMNQLGRRNLTEEQRSYLRGKRHSEEKSSHGGARRKARSSSHSENLKTAVSSSHSDTLKTHQRLAQEYKVAPSTIIRDAKFAEAVDLIAAENGPEARVLLLNPEAGFTKKETIRLVTEPPEVRAEVFASKKKRTEWKKAPEPVSGDEVTEKQVAAVIAAWNRCGPEAREIIRAKLTAPPAPPGLRVVS